MERVSNRPLISVIVPIYNVEKYLNKCIDSIINQTYTNLEIILVDDGSPDNCPSICDEYANKDSRIVVIHKENGGLSDARNAGIDVAKGDYLTFIDSDDYITSDYIEVLLESLLKNNTDISIGGHIIKYENGREYPKYEYKQYTATPTDVLDKILYDELDLTACIKLFKKELFDGIRFPVGRLYEDAATTYKLIDKASSISVELKPIYYYVIKGGSITNSSFNTKKLDLITSTKEMTDYISNKYPTLVDGCNRRLMYAYLSTYTQYSKSLTRNKSIERDLSNYIKINKKKVLKDKRLPRRDKYGIISVSMGYHFFKLIWKIYTFIGGKKYE